MKPDRSGRPVNAHLALPSVLGPGIAYRLPLQIGDVIGSATGERLNVVLPVARTSPADFARRRAGMLSLELSRYFSGSVFFRSEQGWRDCSNDHEHERPGKTLRPTI
jgi:hypothetical protein